MLAGVFLGSMASAQMIPTQSVVSSPSATPPSSESVEPVPSVSDTALDPASLLPDLPSLSSAKASLIGGTIERLDRVRDQLTVQVFGGGKLKITFDPRTRVYSNGSEASLSALHKGDRIYVDTILDGSTIFARSIRVKTTGSGGESQGIVVSYRGDNGELTLRDALSPQPLKIRLTSQTQFTQGGHAVSAELLPGTLVAVKFGAQGGRDVAREITVLAVPGASFIFAGVVTALDLRLGILVINSSTDHKTYEISLNPSVAVDADSLRPGTDVTAVANFDGSHYVARSLTINSR